MKNKRLLIFLLGVFIISPVVFANQDSTIANQDINKSLDEGITSSQGNDLSVETQLIQVPIGPSCEGNNHENNSFLDNVLMGGPVVGISWIPTHSVTITHIEVFTGETTGPIALAIWSDDGGSPSKPLSNLGNTNYVAISLTNSWQGADLLTPVTVTAGTKYWVIFDPNGGEQSPVMNTGIQQTYWGSYSGDVTGGTSWFGPFSFTDRRWKFRMMCGSSNLVDLDKFTATPQNNGVSLSWTTKTELDSQGFRIWRAIPNLNSYCGCSGNIDDYTQIQVLDKEGKPVLIPAKGNKTVGSEYSYLDKGAKPGVAYCYALEDVDSKGESKFYFEHVAFTPDGLSEETK